MSGLLQRLLWSLCVLGVASPAVGQAVATHYQTLLVGDRSMGMGTAFTGLANDGSAVYYNPGGLVNRQRAAITGGFWLNAFDRKELEGGIRRDYGTFDIVSRSAPSFPAFVASSLSLGALDARGRRPYVLSVSAFQVRRERFQSLTDMFDSVTGLEDTFEVEHDERDYFYGLSLARRLPGDGGAGVSLFLAKRDYTHDEIAYTVTGTDPFDIDMSRGASLHTTLRKRSYLLVMRFGVLRPLSPRVQLGVMLQAPGIPLKSRANRRFQRLRYDVAADPGSAGYQVDTERDLRSRAPIPPELRVGIAHKVSRRITWTGDLSVVVPLVDREVVEGQRQRASAGEGALFVVPDTGGVPVANVALGLETRFSNFLYGQLGVFTDFSSGGRVPERTSTYAAPRVHQVGLTASVAVRGKQRGMAVGLSGVLGRGKGLAADVSDETRVLAYRRASIRSRTVFISLTGAIESAEQLARAAASKVAPSAVEGAEIGLPQEEAKPERKVEPDPGDDGTDSP